MTRTRGPTPGGAPQEEPAAGPSLSSRPSVKITPQTPDPSSSPTPTKEEDIPLLSRDEKRRILAQIVRLNPLDCFDDSGAFDIARAKRVLPACAVRHIIVHETTRTDPEGNPVTQRKIHLRLVDPLSAMRLDDQLERRRESPPAPADSDALSAEAEAEREAGAARAREYLKEKLLESQEKGTPYHFAYLFDPEEPWTTATPETPTPTPATQPAAPPTPLPESNASQPAGPLASAQESGRGIPAPSKKAAQQPRGKDAPSTLSSNTAPSTTVVPPSTKSTAVPPPAARPPPPLDPMSFAAQGRPKYV